MFGLFASCFGSTKLTPIDSVSVEKLSKANPRREFDPIKAQRNGTWREGEKFYGETTNKKLPTLVDSKYSRTLLTFDIEFLQQRNDDETVSNRDQRNSAYFDIDLRA